MEEGGERRIWSCSELIEFLILCIPTKRSTGDRSLIPEYHVCTKLSSTMSVAHGFRTVGVLGSSRSLFLV
jgi:hypothetical protein